MSDAGAPRTAGAGGDRPGPPANERPSVERVHYLDLAGGLRAMAWKPGRDVAPCVSGAVRLLGTARSQIRSLDVDLFQSTRIDVELGTFLSMLARGFKSGASADIDRIHLVGALWEAAAWAQPGYSVATLAGFATAARQARDPALVLKVWPLARSIEGKFRPETWGAFAMAATVVGSEMAGEVWDAYLARRAVGGLGAFATAAASLGEVSLLTRVMEAARSGPDTVDLASWGALVTAAVRLNETKLIRASLNAFIRSHSAPAEASAGPHRGGSIPNAEALRVWGTLIAAAQKLEDPRLLRELWERTRPMRSQLQLNNLLAFCGGVQGTDDREMLVDVYRQIEHLQPPLQEKTWGLLATAAANARAPELLAEMFETYRAVHPASRTAPAPANADRKILAVAAFASAAGRIGQVDLLRTIWSSVVEWREPLEAGHWSALATAAADAEDEDLLVEIWESCSEVGSTLTGVHLAAFATACGELGAPALLRQVWTAARAGATEPESSFWGALAMSAGRVDDGVLLEEVFNEVRRRQTPLEDVAIGSFVNAAGRGAHGALLRRIWEAFPLEWAPANHGRWANYLMAAEVTGDISLLRDMFRHLAAGRDPTVYVNWGWLHPPLVRIANRCSDADLKAEMLVVLRDGRPNWALLEEVLRHHPPVPLGEKGNRFEGACRCLTRHLVYVNAFRPLECEAVIVRVVELVNSLSESNRILAWCRVVGSGQDSYGMAARTKLAGLLRSTLELPDVPPGEWSVAQREQFEERLMDPGPGGLVRRVNDFMSALENQEAAEDLPVLDPRWSAVIEYQVDNFMSHFHRKAGTSKDGSNDHFQRIHALLIEAGAKDFTTADGARFLGQLIDTMSTSLRQELEERWPGIVHDLFKSVTLEAANRMSPSTMDPVVRAGIANDLLSLVQSFELAIGKFLGIANELSPINVSSPITRFLGRTRTPCRMIANIEKGLTLMAWPGVRENALEPLLRAIRQNLEVALQQLDEPDRECAISVSRSGDWIRFRIENTFDPGAGPTSTSTGYGLRGIRRMVAFLGGRLVPPFPELDLTSTPSRWIQSFDLPAASSTGDES